MKKTKIHIGRIFRFHGIKYNSVGYFYKLEYDQTAFDTRFYDQELYKPKMEDYHLNPKKGKKECRIQCGSMEETERYALTARKYGIFKVEDTHFHQKQIKLNV